MAGTADPQLQKGTCAIFPIISGDDLRRLDWNGAGQIGAVYPGNIRRKGSSGCRLF